MISVSCKKNKNPYFFLSSCLCPDSHSVTLFSEKSFLLWKIYLVKSLVDLSVHSVSLRLPEDTLPQVTKSLRLISEAEEWLYLGGVWELSWEPVSWKLRETEVSWMLRFSCPGGHSTACKCCWEAEMQWDWSTWQLEAGRSQLDVHTAWVELAQCDRHSLCSWGERLHAAGHEPCAGPEELGCGPGLQGDWRKWLQYVLKAQRNSCNWFKDILSLQRMSLMSLAGTVSLWTHTVCFSKEFPWAACSAPSHLHTSVWHVAVLSGVVSDSVPED